MNSQHGNESITQDVVREVAARADVQPDELPPLYDFIDPDALNRVINSTDADLQLSFVFAGYRVTIEGDGSIRVQQDD